jgi:hypothetical protein
MTTNFCLQSYFKILIALDFVLINLLIVIEYIIFVMLFAKTGMRS